MKQLQVMQVIFISMFMTVGSLQAAADSNAQANRATQSTAQIAKKVAEVAVWDFSVAPTLWAPAVNGALVEDSIPSTFDASQSSRIQHLRPGGEVLIEGRHGNIVFGLQPQYANVFLNGLATTPVGQLPLNVTAKRFLIEYWVGRRFDGNDHFWVDVIGGGRYSRLDIDSQSILGYSESRFDVNDLLIGIRAGKQFTRHFGVLAMFTESGFNLLNESSQRTWEARLGTEIKLSRHLSIDTGYRIFKTTSRDSKDDLPRSIEYQLKGVYLGAKYDMQGE